MKKKWQKKCKSRTTVFEVLKPLPPDAILGIKELFSRDRDPNKVDLSVGVYQDEEGLTPVPKAVRLAEDQVLQAQTTKAYVAIAGNAEFNHQMELQLFGSDHRALRDGRISTVQTPGGSGGLSVAAEIICRAQPDAKIWLSDPTWPNHKPLLSLPGLKLQQYPYYDYINHKISFEKMLSTIKTLGSGDIVVLHGCCHNPCGADLSSDQWGILTELFEQRGIMPLIDLAYQGLSEGLEEDVYGIRLMAESLPEAIVVASCSKNFGLFRERVGAISIVSKDTKQAAATLSNASNIARGIYSMPPDHGAAIVASIFCEEELRKLWVQELGEMRERINELRCLLVDKLSERESSQDFSFIANERGMFSFLGISRSQVIRLREEFHVYLVESSRINMAGINQSNVDYVSDAIVGVL